ncbi:hypothetical protein K474DRAFT_358756 [Panus rudis PR-1116 ss-1]|nr:hypothetical protein K474DRAFT_358756 [Panus rudis PR-1116 ss-1]
MLPSDQDHMVDRLPRAEAAFDLEVWRVMSQCYGSTRRGTLQVVENWTGEFSKDSPRIFWLYGPPGIGKTAVAKSVASYAQQHGFLAANFFFSLRIGRNCSDGMFLIPTIAHQLSSFHPTLKAFIAAALEEDAELPRRTIEAQFHNLFQQPLLLYLQQSSMNQEPETPIVIVLDGLDECGDHDMMEKILTKLVMLAPQLHPRLKLFLASRPESHITSILRRQPKGCVHVYDFQNMERSCSAADVEVYLRETLNDIAGRKQWDAAGPWPAPSDLAQLVVRAGGLFIYAATVVRFIERSLKIPSAALRIILDESNKVARINPLAPIDELYRTILENAIASAQDPEAFTRYLQCILVTVQTSKKTPAVPGPTIGYLTWVLQKEYVSIEAILQPLHSVLNVRSHRRIGWPGSLEASDFIVTHHRSFNEFIQDETRCGAKLAVTSRAMKSFAILHFTLLNEGALDLDEGGLSQLEQCLWVSVEVLDQYVLKFSTQGKSIKKWPMELSSVVTRFFEDELPQMLVRLQDKSLRD